MSNLVPIKVSLSDANKKRLAAGGAIRLKHHQLKDGDIEIKVCCKKAKRMCKACRLGKGITLDLSQPEYKASSSGGKLDWGKVKKAFSKRNMKEFGKDLAKGAIRGGIQAAASTLGSLAGPEGTMLAGLASKPLAEYAVRKSGLGIGKEIATYSTLGLTRGYIPDTSGSGFLGPVHPAMQLKGKDTRLPDNSVKRGGSFLAAGYGLNRGSCVHPARTPATSHSDLPSRM